VVAAGTTIDLVVNSGTIGVTSCIAPALVGRTLKAAKAALTKAHCRVGSVRQAYSKKAKKGVVISQSRAPRKVLPMKTKINLVISKGRGPSGGGSAHLRTFVDAVEKELRSSAAARRKLAAALTVGFGCAVSPVVTEQRLTAVVGSRMGVLGRLVSLRAPTAQASKALKLLEQALADSIKADRYYRAGFFDAAESGCPLPRNASFRLAAKSDALATALKKRFVAAFNPIAKSLGRSMWSAAKI
jgi:hypothetical protein